MLREEKKSLHDWSTSDAPCDPSNQAVLLQNLSHHDCLRKAGPERLSGTAVDLSLATRIVDRAKRQINPFAPCL